MCTATYLPVNKHDFILTSSRDEKLERIANATLIEKRSGNSTIVYPEDPLSNGSWVGCSSNGIAGCLLNGAFGKYKRTPPYKKSRGVVFIEILESLGSTKFFTPEYLKNIEPFTLVIVKFHVQQRYVQELRWDGLQIHNLTIDSESQHLWASAVLFDDQAIKDKKKNFSQFLHKTEKPSPEDIIGLHQSDELSGQKYFPDFNDMKGGMVNLTQIVRNNNQLEIHHSDLQKNDMIHRNILQTFRL